MTGVTESFHQHDPVKEWIHQKVPHFVRELIAGGAAGAVGKTSVAPLERTKILLMTGRSQAGAFATLRLILVTEGVRGLFRGNSASCLRIMPYAAIHFSVYEVYRRMLAEHVLPVAPYLGGAHAPPPAGPGRKPPPAAASLSVADSGGSASARGSVHGEAASGMEEEEAAVVVAPPPVLTSSIEISTANAVTAAELGLATPGPGDLSGSEVAAGDMPCGSGPATAQHATEAHLHPTSGASSTKQQQQQDRHHHHHHHHAPKVRLGPLGDLLAGSAAGATAVLTTYPLDVVRTRLAWGMEQPRASGGTVRSASGGSGGATPAAGAAMPLPKPAAAPAVATAAATAPVEASAANVAKAAQHHSRIIPMLAHIVQHEGVLGLYSGLAPTLYGIVPYAGLKFFVYGWLKQWYRTTLRPLQLQAEAAAAPGGTQAGTGTGTASSGSDSAGGRRCNSGSAERLPVPYMLAFGAVSGLLAQTVTYPLDVVRRRMQVSGLQREAAAAGGSGVAAAAAAAAGGSAAVDVGSGGRLTTWSALTGIVRREGLRGLTRGITINYIKVIPSTAIGFTTYELFKSYLGVTGNL